MLNVTVCYPAGCERKKKTTFTGTGVTLENTRGIKANKGEVKSRIQKRGSAPCGAWDPQLTPCGAWDPQLAGGAGKEQLEFKGILGYFLNLKPA